MPTKDARGETRIDAAGPLHKGDGSLACPGYATSLLLEYRRRRVKAPSWRIKEWDYYLVNDDEYAVALTLSDMGYVGLISVSVVDFVRTKFKTTSVITPFPFGRFRMPESSAEGVSQFENNRVSMRFEVKNGTRRLRAVFRRFEGNEDFSFDAVLDDEPRDSMVIATPWAEDNLAFYYNQKIVAMRAEGSFKRERSCTVLAARTRSACSIGGAACGRATTRGSGHALKDGKMTAREPFTASGCT